MKAPTRGQLVSGFFTVYGTWAVSVFLNLLAAAMCFAVYLAIPGVLVYRWLVADWGVWSTIGIALLVQIGVLISHLCVVAPLARFSNQRLLLIVEICRYGRRLAAREAADCAVESTLESKTPAEPSASSELDKFIEARMASLKGETGKP